MVRTRNGEKVAAYNTTSTSISSFGDQNSQTTGNGNYVRLRVTPTAGASNIQLTYSNSSPTLDASDNYQYIGIGDVRFCF